MNTQRGVPKILQQPATVLRQHIDQGELSASELTAACLGQVERVNPRLNAICTISEQALDDAAELDRQAAVGEPRGPLHGLPVGIKDITPTAGLRTTYGSPLYADHVPDQDAEVVRRIRAAGAVIIGKTNVPELTLWPWTASQHWGVTRNPWDLDRTCGGSSGGSAAAVCTGMAALALGSDGGGSVRYPAGLTGLVGLKPQRDRVTVGPEHASGWHGLIALGPLARSVRDAARFLDVVGPENNATVFSDAATTPLGRLQIAVSTNAPPGSQVKLSAGRLAQIEESAELLATLGHEISEVEVDYGIASLWNSTVRYLKGAQHDVATIVERGELESRTRAVARMGRLISDRSLGAALRREERVATSINRVFDHADVVLTPLCESPAPTVDDCPAAGAIRSLRAANTSAWLIPWNLTGQPAIVVPTGLDDDAMPTAIQLVGRPGDEATLLSLAGQLETARPFPAWSGLA